MRDHLLSPLACSSVRFRPPEGSVALLSDLLQKLPRGHVLRKTGRAQTFDSNSVSVERIGSRSTNVLLFDHENAIFFFNCENKSQFTWNSLDRSFWTQTSPAPHPHYSRCSPLKMSKIADNFKKRRHISRYVFFFSLGPLSASGRFHILHRKACSDAAAWPFLLLLGESRSLIVSQGL